MKRSQWVTLPKIDTSGQHSGKLSKSVSMPALSGSLPQVAWYNGDQSVPRSQYAVTEPLPTNSDSWKHPRWGAGSKRFGPPPLAKLNGRLLRARIAHLERSVAKARAEVDFLSYEVMERSTEFRGFVQAELRTLEQELALCLAERDRRKEEGLCQSSKRTRCVHVPEEPVASAALQTQKVLLTHSVSEPSLLPRILQDAL